MLRIDRAFFLAIGLLFALGGAACSDLASADNAGISGPLLTSASFVGTASYPANEGDSVAWGAIILRNDSLTPIDNIVASLEPASISDEFQVLSYIVEIGRDGSPVTVVDEWDNIQYLRIVPLEGYILPSGIGDVELLLRVTPRREGIARFEGVHITYFQGSRDYVADVTSSLIICTPFTTACTPESGTR